MHIEKSLLSFDNSFNTLKNKSLFSNEKVEVSILNHVELLIYHDNCKQKKVKKVHFNDKDFIILEMKSESDLYDINYPNSDDIDYDNYRKTFSNIVKLPFYITKLNTIEYNYNLIEEEFNKNELEETELDVLNDIDPVKLNADRTGGNKKNYNLNELRNFSRRLGISVSGKKKNEIIKNITNKAREKGINWEIEF